MEAAAFLTVLVYFLITAGAAFASYRVSVRQTRLIVAEALKHHEEKMHGGNAENGPPNSGG